MLLQLHYCLTFMEEFVMLNKKFKILPIIIFLILILLFISCNSEEEIPSTAVVYVYDSFTDNLKEAIGEYIKTNYSVEVKFEVFEDTGPMIASLIREKNEPKADVVIGVDNSFGLDILDADVLEVYTPKNLKLENESLSFDKSGRLTPYDYGYVVINYNSEKLINIPKNFEDLTNKIYKENIAVMSPETSSTGRIFFLETIARFGEDGYLDFWEKFKPSITNITSGWSDAYYGLYIQGESDMVISYTTSPPAHVIYESTDKYKALIFDDSAYIQVESCGIIKNAKNRVMAEKIIDYIVSKEFQDKIPENQFMFPINPDAKLPEEFIQYAPKPKKALILDTNLVKNNLKKWLSDWEKIILK